MERGGIGIVSFTKLSVRNFKRFSGHHEIALSGDGRVTVIAAENGVGKTTLMEAIHLAIYGKRGFSYLYPKESFSDWLESAYSVDAESEDKHILLALEMNDPIIGRIRVARTFWMLEGSVLEEDIEVEVNGKPLEREKGESVSSLSEGWIEDYLPHSAMRKFFVDGERLSHLDPKRINDEVVGGIDDVIGIGLLHRLRRRLEYVRRSTLRSMTSEEQSETMEQVLQMQEDSNSELTEATNELMEHESRAVEIAERISDVQEEIESLSMQGGDQNVQLRMLYAVKQSELTSSRKEIHQHLMGGLPFIIAKVPTDINDWEIRKIIESKRSIEKTQEMLDFLRSAVSKSGVEEEIGNRLIDAGLEISESLSTDEEGGWLSYLSREYLEKIESVHSTLGLDSSYDEISDSFNRAILRLEEFEEVEQSLRMATAGTGVGEKAEELRGLATELGSSQAEVARLKGVVEQCKLNSVRLVEWIDRLRQNDDPGSKLNKRLSRIEQLLELVSLVTESVRSSFAGPLQDSFAEGFELLSRKSGNLEKVDIDTSDYSVHLSMKGFEGNWLDRSLSATEKQHVGLSLVYALRRSSTQWSLPLPVVVDTPTSRMDKRHKGWSVKKFYPQLSNQVIVFATSDDLSGGLFTELEEAGSLGKQYLISEISENSVSVDDTDLRVFFGG